MRQSYDVSIWHGTFWKNRNKYYGTTFWCKSLWPLEQNDTWTWQHTAMTNMDHILWHNLQLALCLLTRKICNIGVTMLFINLMFLTSWYLFWIIMSFKNKIDNWLKINWFLLNIFPIFLPPSKDLKHLMWVKLFLMGFNLVTYQEYQKISNTEDNLNRGWKDQMLWYILTSVPWKRNYFIKIDNRTILNLFNYDL